jgi:DNA-binding NtrC family response regulator
MPKPKILTLAETVAAAERGAILKALRITKGSRRDAARLLDVPERTFHRLLERLELGPTLATLAERYRWPSQTARAQEAWRAKHEG